MTYKNPDPPYITDFKVGQTTIVISRNANADATPVWLQITQAIKGKIDVQQNSVRLFNNSKITLSPDDLQYGFGNDYPLNAEGILIFNISKTLNFDESINNFQSYGIYIKTFEDEDTKTLCNEDTKKLCNKDNKVVHRATDSVEPVSESTELCSDAVKDLGKLIESAYGIAREFKMVGARKGIAEYCAEQNIGIPHLKSKLLEGNWKSHSPEFSDDYTPHDKNLDVMEDIEDAIEQLKEVYACKITHEGSSYNKEDETSTIKYEIRLGENARFDFVLDKLNLVKKEIDQMIPYIDNLSYFNMDSRIAKYDDDCGGNWYSIIDIVVRTKQ